MISNKGRLSLWPISSWRIGFKMMLSFLLLTLVPLILITSFVNTYSRNSLLSQGAASLQATGRSTVRQIEHHLADEREYITVVGQMPELARFVQTPTDASAVDSALKT